MATAASIRDYVTLLRPRDWIKNLFVLSPLVFSGKFRDPEAVQLGLLAMLVFSVVSSATYVWNDLCDRSDDAMHPVKRHTRAIAAGRVSVGMGRAYLVVLLLISAGLLYLMPAVVPAVIAYLVLQTAYGLILRQVPVLDLFAIAVGFIFRVMAGSAAIDVKTSSWMMIATLSLALYLAASKRLAEMRSTGNMARLTLQRYDEATLEFFTQTSALSMAIFYVLFTVLERPVLLHTSFFVFLGMFRYRYVTQRDSSLETPSEILWNDKLLLTILLLWVIDCGVTLYLFPPPPLP
ncbi:MAG: UbiA family prenyltransferase [Bryobacterales bacterium]|nr:UbiA family prenyltransferase [Bryobacterales bacterium]